MARLVEEIAEADDAHGFANEVCRKARAGAAEHANHRIQFLSSTLKIGASYREVGEVGGCGGDEEGAVLRVPKPVLVARVPRSGGDGRRGFNEGIGRVRKRALGGECLGSQGRTSEAHDYQSGD